MRYVTSRRSEGFSLIEILTAITILGLIAAPIGASLVLSFRLNARSRQLMQDQLAVSSAVEKLMAEGITDASEAYRSDDFPEVIIKTERAGAAYQVTVSSKDTDLDVTVKTYIRPAETPDTEGAEDPDGTGESENGG